MVRRVPRGGKQCFNTVHIRYTRDCFSFVWYTSDGSWLHMAFPCPADLPPGLVAGEILTTLQRTGPLDVGTAVDDACDRVCCGVAQHTQVSLAMTLVLLCRMQVTRYRAAAKNLFARKNGSSPQKEVSGITLLMGVEMHGDYVERGSVIDVHGQTDGEERVRRPSSHVCPALAQSTGAALPLKCSQAASSCRPRTPPAGAP